MTKRVVSVIPSNTFGGAHNQALKLQADLESAGYSTVVVLPTEAGNADALLTAAGVPIIRMRLRRIRANSFVRTLTFFLALPSQVVRLVAVFRREQAALVQAHGLLQVDVAIAARLARVPLVWQVLDTRPPALLRCVISPLMVWLSAVIMTTGTTTGLAYNGIRRTTRRHVVAFYPPVAESSLVTLPRAENDSVTFGSLANLNPQKGQETLIRAFHAAQLDDASYLLIRGAVAPGHESIPSHLCDLIAALGLKNVTITPGFADVVEFMRETDVVLLGSESNSEGTPTVILEAMWAGRAVVATNVGGVKELVIPDETGYLVEPGDCSGIAANLRELAADRDKRERLGDAARVLARSNFSVERTLEAYHTAYAVALARGR